MAKYKLKLIDGGNKVKDGTPQFTLLYNAEKGKPQTNISYEVLSLLKGDHDVVIEVDTALIIQSKNNNKFSHEEFITEIRNRKLEYSYKKSQSQKQDFFSFLFKAKKIDDDHNITVYVPDNVWMDETLQNILPTCGVKYYIMKKTDDARTVLDKMNLMLDEEKFEYFEYIIFDVSEFNQMGISSKHFGLNDIKKLLGII
ncbi:MAG: hypothetical protein GX796_13435 [Clostridiaceae bacterium]|nr:hypothetical protein [Clostridiaceae bacterium]